MIKEKLHQATFKGVPFFWRRLSTELGKKSVSHNYPGTGRRFVEDMGALPKIFSIEATIAGGPGGQQYLENKQALEDALASPGAGYLVHPTYGRVLVTAKPATCIEESRALGAASYSLTFEKSEEFARPVGSSANLREVSLANNQAMDDIVAASAEKWSLPESPAIFGLITDNLKALTDQIDSAAGLASSVRSEVRQVSDGIASFKKSISTLVTQPMGLFTDLKGIYEQVMSMDDFANDQFDRITGFFSGTTDGQPGDPETTSRVNAHIRGISYETLAAEKNRVTSNEASNMMALVGAYSALANADYQSTEQLDQFVSAVEAHFEVMQKSDLMNTPIRDSLLRLRIAAHQVVEQKRIRAKKLVIADMGAEMPLAVVSFMYGGEAGEFMPELNPEQDPSFSTGEIKVLQ